jgi:predicted TIM-barrel fold metal-dependent hydrolase
VNSPVIDFHAHAGRWGRVRMDDDVDRHVALMDAAGIDKACINCVFYGDARRSNDYAVRFARERPDRFYFAAFASPHYPEEVARELDRAIDTLGAKFVKIYPDYVALPLESPVWTPIFDWVNERGLAIMTHARLAHVPDRAFTVTERFTNLSERYPGIKWVMAHAAGAANADAINAAATLPNVYMETCSSSGTHRAVQHSVEGAGADRVLFGTDQPLLDPRNQIAKVLAADISDDAKRRVLGLNAVELLGLDV